MFKSKIILDIKTSSIYNSNKKSDWIVLVVYSIGYSKEGEYCWCSLKLLDEGLKFSIFYRSFYLF